MPSSTVEPSPSPSLQAAREARDRGDYPEARRLARGTLSGLSVESKSADAERREAEEIVAETAPDRAVYWLLAACAVFLVLAFLRYAGK